MSFVLLISGLNMTLRSDTDCNRIVFSDSAYRLFWTDTDSMDISQFSEISRASNPAWSPDGQKIAYTHNLEDIFVLDIETSEVIQLTDSKADTFTRNINPAWAPSGEKIAFASDRNGNWELYVMDADGSNQTRLTNNEADDAYNGLTWTPDGEGIAFVRNIGIEFDEATNTYETQQIYLIDLGNTIEKEVNLTTDIDVCPAGEVYYNPRWSYTANYLVFSMTCGGDGMDIYLLDVSETLDPPIQYVNLTQHAYVSQAGYGGLTWSPDGNHIAYVAIVEEETHDFEILMLDVNAALDGDEPTISQITETSEDSVFHGIDWQSCLDS